MSKLKKKRSQKKHAWRECPLGEHWVRTHSRSTASKVSGHCRKNPSGKDQLYFDELELIASTYFQKLKGPPCSHSLGFSQGKKYDHLIRGWTKFWNEILKPKTPLDPDLVKALIATESGFRSRAKAKAGKRAGWARGLIQITDWTQRILADENGEIKDHYVNVAQKEMINPNTNIAAGIRWLHRKKETASSKLGREATWEEAIGDYKAYLRDMMKGKTPRPMKDLRDFYDKLKVGCE